MSWGKARALEGEALRAGRHTVTYGVDQQYGGVFVEGPHDGPARDLQKEFWQQAESLVGLLDCYSFSRSSATGTRSGRCSISSGSKLINHPVGEWFALLDRDGTVKWDYMGHAWKNNYHTTRSMVQTLRRLKKIEEPGLPAVGIGAPQGSRRFAPSALQRLPPWGPFARSTAFR